MVVLLPIIEEKLAAGMSHREIETELGLEGDRPVHNLLKQQRRKAAKGNADATTFSPNDKYTRAQVITFPFEPRTDAIRFHEGTSHPAGSFVFLDKLLYFNLCTFPALSNSSIKNAKYTIFTVEIPIAFVYNVLIAVPGTAQIARRGSSLPERSSFFNVQCQQYSQCLSARPRWQR